MDIACKNGRGASITSLGECRTVIVSFEDRNLSFPTANPLKKFLGETIRSKASEGYVHFVLNFQNVEIVDSTGIGLIIMAQKA